MLKPPFDYRPVTSLIPNTGIQFLDFALKQSDVERLSRTFWPEVHEDQRDEEGRPLVTLHPLVKDEEGRFLYKTESAPKGIEPPEDETFSVRASQAMELLDRQWLPLPFLREAERGPDNQPIYDEGPTNWARMRIAALPEVDAEGYSHRLVVAFDTLLLERRKDGPYAGPTPQDAMEDVEFCLVSAPEANRPFLILDWVRSWLQDSYIEGRTRRRGRPTTLADLKYPGEYWANFIVLLEAVAAGCKIPRIRFTDTVTESIQGEPIDVDLVIDVGNSRTCGVLIEQSKQLGSVDISQCYRLELRDLTRPEQCYSDPFESRVEFTNVAFGRREYSRRSGRPRRDAFWWPSPVRVGPEAAWLASLADGTEGISGLSSPKRYLWDEASRPQAWTNNRGTLALGRPVPAISGPMTAKLTEEGDLVSPKRPNAVVGMSPRYSRSSLYTLMLAELLSHAIGQLNSVSVREQQVNSDLPRRLSSFILTLPSATPLAEQKILRRRAEWAVDLVWQTMGWSDADPIHKKPKIKLDWDEATCTHLVYLYNEINHKFRRNPHDFFQLVGQRKQLEGEGPALRIASMDIGGGTTDLMIIQHEIEAGQQQTIRPRQLFREGFRQAGDDIVKSVIEHCVLPQLGEALRAHGVGQPDVLLSELFGGDRAGVGQPERSTRALLTTQILVPAALGLLSAYEALDPRRPSGPQHLKLSDLLPPDRLPAVSLLAYFDRAVGNAGGSAFDPLAMDLVMDTQEIAGAVHFVVQRMIEDLCDIIRAYDCDLLLLSGRPSRFPAVRDLIYSNLPLPANRVVPMDGYEVGAWYPFRSPDYRINDPKTTTAVGAMLCQICEGFAPGFVMRASAIKMKSTARFIGSMETNGQILEKNCHLENADLMTGANVVEFAVPMEAPVFIGFRQLPLERWKTTPLYYLYFRTPEKHPHLATPISVTLERAEPRDEFDEVVLEDFSIAEAIDAEGEDVARQIGLRLQTMFMDQQAEGGYWLDTGVLKSKGRA